MNTSNPAKFKWTLYCKHWLRYSRERALRSLSYDGKSKKQVQKYPLHTIYNPTYVCGHPVVVMFIVDAAVRVSSVASICIMLLRLLSSGLSNPSSQETFAIFGCILALWNPAIFACMMMANSVNLRKCGAVPDKFWLYWPRPKCHILRGQHNNQQFSACWFNLLKNSERVSSVGVQDGRRNRRDQDT